MPIDTDLDEIAKRGDVRAYRIAHLALFVIAAEAAEGRTNRVYTSTLEMLIEENAKLKGKDEGE